LTKPSIGVESTPLEVFEQTLQQAYDAAQQAPKIEISSGPTCDIETGNCQ